MIGLAKHSETEEIMVLYCPLYEVKTDSWVYGYDYAVRPLSMWYDMVEWNGQKVQRFTEM